MDPSDSVDMAAPSTYNPRLSLLSTSTMDDDFLSEHSLSGFDSPLSDISESAPTDKHTPFSYTHSGMLTKGRFSRSPVGDRESRTSQSADEEEEHQQVRSSTTVSENISEQLDVKQINDSHSSFPSPKQEQHSLICEREHLDDPRALVARSISDEEKKSTMSKLLARAASNGDLDRLTDILKNFRDWVDINTHDDDDGSTPLIYAACFGQTSAVSKLLSAGASVDERDSFGWTALVWATNNKHEHVVRLLLNHGASPKTRTAKGRTVDDFLRHDPNDTSKIAKIFKEPARVRPSAQARSALWDLNNLNRETMTEDEPQHKMNNMEDLDADMTDDDDDKSVSEESEPEDEVEFDWDKCRIDQMLVFSSKDIPHLIRAIITTMAPTRSKPYRPVPAYVLFLAARFAHNFGTSDLLGELLETTLDAIQFVTQSNPDDVTLCTFWISNTSSLLHFLRKDAGLRSASKVYEERIEIMLRDMAQNIILDAQKRMEPILEAAILEHVTIVGLKDVKYQTDWAFSIWRGIERGRRSIRRSNRFSAPPPFTPCEPIIPTTSKRPSLQIQRPPSGPSPKAITTILSSLLKTLRAFDIHPEIIHYMVAQLLYCVGCKVFNQMIENRKHLARSHALQTRLNISVLEDWLRNSQLPSRLADQMAPLIQLLQLLQVLSLQKDLATWIETRKNVDLLNPTQVKHVVGNYRYEVNEERLPAEITKYVLQVIADTEKVKRQSRERKRSDSVVSMSVASSRRNSQSRSSECSQEEMELGETCSIKSRSGEVESPEEDDMALSCTTKNSTIWILFQIPTNLAARAGDVEREFFPQVPEEVMTLLDNKVYSRNGLI